VVAKANHPDWSAFPVVDRGQFESWAQEYCIDPSPGEQKRLLLLLRDWGLIVHFPRTEFNRNPNSDVLRSSGSSMSGSQASSSDDEVGSSGNSSLEMRGTSLLQSLGLSQTRSVESSQLSEMIIVKPQWLCDFFRTLISEKHKSKVVGGAIDRKVMEERWRKAKFEERWMESLWEMLTMFELCYPKPKCNNPLLGMHQNAESHSKWLRSIAKMAPFANDGEGQGGTGKAGVEDDDDKFIVPSSAISLHEWEMNRTFPALLEEMQDITAARRIGFLCTWSGTSLRAGQGRKCYPKFIQVPLVNPDSVKETKVKDSSSNEAKENGASTKEKVKEKHKHKSSHRTKVLSTVLLGRQYQFDFLTPGYFSRLIIYVISDFYHELWDLECWNDALWICVPDSLYQQANPKDALHNLGHYPQPIQVMFELVEDALEGKPFVRSVEMIIQAHEGQEKQARRVFARMNTLVDNFTRDR
jgi:hypothetical protein